MVRGFGTKAVHGARTRIDQHGALRPPVYDSVAFEFNRSHDLELAFAGKSPSHTYSRITNPTVEEFEQRIRLLSGALGVIAVASGMAAIANVVAAVAEPGANVVSSRHIFGHTYSLFVSTLGKWGLETRFVDMTDIESVAEKIDAKTRMIFLETITNPQLEVADIEAVCKVAAEKGVPVVLDGTMTTPYLFEAKAAGVAVEILSSTKFLSGGATAVGGLIIDYGTHSWSTNPSLATTSRQAGPAALLVKLRKEVYRNFGASLAPHNAWLQMLGLETLPLRINKSCENALALARFMEQRPEVRSVNYPGLPSSPHYIRAMRQLKYGAGGLLTFELSGRESAYRFMDGCTLIRKATNIHDNKSLIIHPASTIFADFSAEDRAKMNVGEGMVRLSAGIEDVEDLMEDLAAGLEQV